MKLIQRRTQDERSGRDHIKLWRCVNRPRYYAGKNLTGSFKIDDPGWSTGEERNWDLLDSSASSWDKAADTPGMFRSLYLRPGYLGGTSISDENAIRRDPTRYADRSEPRSSPRG